jgi:hypothetical protein
MTAAHRYNAGFSAIVLALSLAGCESAKPSGTAQNQGTGGETQISGSGGAASSMGSGGFAATTGSMASGGRGAAGSGAMGSGGMTSSVAMGSGGMHAGTGGTPGTGTGGTGETTEPDAGMHPARDAGTSGPTFHVFLLLGQSNMAGYPKAQDADKVKNDRIKVLGYDDCAATGRKQDEWDVAVPPLHECWNGAIGPGDYFSKTIIDKLPAGDTIGLVPCAISGEKIETFLKDGGTKYDWIVQRAKLAQQAGGVIEGILFHQGESNNGDPSWPGKVNTLVTDLRNDLGLGEIPFLAGELAYDGGCAGHNKLVNMLPDVVSNAYVVSADGLMLDPADTQWHLHFGHDSQVTFGMRYAETMTEALHW